MSASVLEVLESRHLLTGTISGSVYNDLNGNGVRDGSEAVRPGLSLAAYVDLNHDGILSSGEPSQSLYGSGTFSFANLPAGTYAVRLSVGNAMSVRQTGPSSNAAITAVVTDGGTTNVAFGAQPLFGLQGEVFNDANRDGQHSSGEGFANSPQQVYLDLNRNGALDSTDTVLTTSTSYEFRVPAGTYSVRVKPGAGFVSTTPARTVTLDGYSGALGVDFGVATAPAGATGVISGFTFDDKNANGFFDSSDVKAANKTIFLDADNDGVYDSGEKKVTSAADGSWTFTGLAAGYYHVRRAFPSGYAQSTAKIDVSLADGQTLSGYALGGRAGTSANSATLMGYAFNDANADGQYDAPDTLAVGKTVWLDLNDNGVKDAAEPSVVTDASGQFLFRNLAAGTYHVRRVFSSGYVESTPPRRVTLADGQTVVGVAIGSRTR